MHKRLSPLTTSWLDISKTIEAVLVGIFFLQSLRFLIGILYSRVSSASIVILLQPLDTLPGVVDPAVVQGEIILSGIMIGLPVLTLIFGRFRWTFLAAIVLVAFGRSVMVAETASLTTASAAAVVVGGGLVYTAMLIRLRARIFPYMFILALTIDQIFRAVGNTLDPSWSTEYFQIQVLLSVIVMGLGVINVVRTHQPDVPSSNISPDHGILPFWSAVAFGVILFMELALLALPNAIAGRSGVDYSIFTPFVIAATLLPIVPAIRVRARSWLGSFDSHVRGWVWLLIIALLLVIGIRIQSISLVVPIANTPLGAFPFGGIALVAAQFVVNMIWWWLVRPRSERERNFSGLWLVMAMIVFGLFFVFDLFTYEYAFVQDFAPPLTSLNSVIPPLLRGFRGMGLGVFLFASFLAVIPMILTTRRIPWVGSRPGISALATVLVIIASVGGWIAARPPLAQGISDTSQLRVATYNIHGGYSEFFGFDLEAIALTIQQSGANVILLQEVEAGRLTSFGVDEPLWLARRLGMDVRFYPTNEGLQGLAVLSRVPIVFDDGILLTSIGQQTGLQRVQIQPDESRITLYNTWMGILLAGENIEEQEREQRQQLNEILRVIEAHIVNDYGGQLGRAILGGTFNNVPDSPLIMDIQNTRFSDTFAGSNLENSATLVRTGYKARVDYLWLWEQNLPSNGNGVIETDASDHRLAFVEVITRRGEP